MKKSNVFMLGMLVMMLVFGMTVVGCGNNGLNGTWISLNNPGMLRTYRNGNWESFWDDGRPWNRGSYTRRGNNYTRIITHRYGSSWHRSLESRWYTKEELVASGLFDNNFFTFLNVPQTRTISVNRYTLVLTADDGSMSTYGRREEGRIRGNINGTWTGNIEGRNATLTITNIGWTLTVPGFTDTGTYARDGNHARLSSDNAGGRAIGTADLLNRNLLRITLNQGTVAPGTHIMARR